MRSSIDSGPVVVSASLAQTLEDEPVAVDPGDAIAAGTGGVGQVVGPDALAQPRQIGVEGLAGHLGTGALGRPQGQLDLVGVVGVLVVQDQPAQQLFDDAAVGRLAVGVVRRSGRGRLSMGSAVRSRMEAGWRCGVTGADDDLRLGGRASSAGTSSTAVGDRRPEPRTGTAAGDEATPGEPALRHDDAGGHEHQQRTASQIGKPASDVRRCADSAGRCGPDAGGRQGRTTQAGVLLGRRTGRPGIRARWWPGRRGDRRRVAVPGVAA